MGLDFLAHAYMNEVLAYAVGAAALFGVVAPNSGNQQILVKYGTEEQKQKWLLPLVEGRMESGFSMTEPHNPGSDPRSLDTLAKRDGDHWVINGHKWFTSNGIDADFFIVMCRVQDDTGAYGRTGDMAQIIVPTATRGVNIVRGIGVWGRSTSDHCEVIYENVRVPIDNTLGKVGEGHRAAQDRLGAGRIYHCMNAVGQMWRAFDLMVERAIQVWGAAGVSNDLPLAAMYQGARTLRIADGPDEVHKILIAKNVLARYETGEGWDFGN